MTESDAKPWRNKSILKKLYVDERMSTKEVGERLGCDGVTISRWLNKHDIDTRAQKRRTTEDKELLHNAEKLQEAYSSDQKSVRDIAEEIGCHHSTVEYWLEKHDIEKRPAHSPRGEQHWAWKGGEDRNYGPAWDRKRRSVIQRDGEKCARCGTKREEHREEHSKDLEVHHIENYDNYEDKEVANREGNLITLCISCHNKLEGLPIDTR